MYRQHSFVTKTGIGRMLEIRSLADLHKWVLQRLLGPRNDFALLAGLLAIA